MQRSKLKQYFLNQLLGLDQFLNILLLGDPDDTISSRLGRATVSGRPKWFVKPFRIVVDYVAKVVAGDQNHCVDAVEYEEKLKHELWSWIKD